VVSPPSTDVSPNERGGEEQSCDDGVGVVREPAEQGDEHDREEEEREHPESGDKTARGDRGGVTVENELCADIDVAVLVTAVIDVDGCVTAIEVAPHRFHSATLELLAPPLLPSDFWPDRNQPGGCTYDNGVLCNRRTGWEGVRLDNEAPSVAAQRSAARALRFHPSQGRSAA
jgi:hypothetical protein